MPIVQVDWEKIKEKFEDETAIYAFTHRQASLLLSLSNQLRWTKTFRAFGYDFADYDALEMDVADLQHNLTMPVDLQDIIQYIDEVEELLKALQSTAACCDENSDISDGDYYTDPVVDGVGDVPQNIIDAGYASGTGDWAGFDDYKCMIAHVVVDTMENRLRALLPHIDDAGNVIGGVATLTAIVTAIIGVVVASPLIIVIGILAATGTVALMYKELSGVGAEYIEDLADKVATNHDDLACAIYNGDGSSDSLADLNTWIDSLFEIDEAIILKNMNLGPTLKALYSGRHDQQDIADKLLSAGYDLGDFTCDCDQIGEYLIYDDFETGTYEGWQHNFTELGDTYGVGDSWGVRMHYNGTWELFHHTNSLRTKVGLPNPGGDTVEIHSIKFWHKDRANPNLAIRLVMNHDGGQWAKTYAHTETWVEEEEFFVPPLESTSFLADIIFFKSTGGTGLYSHVDQITVDFDASP